MKKIFLAALVLALPFTILACTNDEDEQDIDILIPEEKNQEKN